MSTLFTQMAAATDTVPPDPSKHVNYTFGMLLGVDDFQQEFAYLNGRDQWMARDLIGYGTVSGLKISLDTIAGKGPRLSVSCGDALTPRGQMVRVCPAQCALLNDWLTANQKDVLTALGSPLSSSIKLWLTLCYRDCPVDSVPIAGEPCRSADDLMAPSRLVDDFSLELRLKPPMQTEEDAVRDFVAWLDQMQIVTSGPTMSLADFEKALRASVVPLASPLSPSTYFQMGSPLNTVSVPASQIGDYLKSAFRIWATEIRPTFHSGWPPPACSCAGETNQAAPPEDCLMLAEVDVPLVLSGPTWIADDTQPVIVDESQRPILLHTRMIQEWMQSGLRGGK